MPIATTAASPTLEWLRENHATLIAKVARREHRGIRTVETEDVEQHIWSVLARKSPKASGGGTDFQTWDTYGITFLVTRIAREYVARERIEYMHFAGAFVYTPAIVEVYLKDAVWANVEDVVDMDGRVDVKAAIASLPLETQRCLFVHYGMDQPYDSKHENTNYKRVYRAVETISDRLNMDSGVKIGDMADAH